MKGLGEEHIRSALKGFRTEGELVDIVPHRRGHIHDTFVSSWKLGGARRRYLHQRMNHRVFTDIPALMHNVQQVSEHLGGRQRRAAGLEGFQVLRLVPTLAGKRYLDTDQGPWRTYHYIEDTVSFDLCDGPDRAREAARAFGWFHAQLVDLDAAGLRETLHRFFSSPYRLEQFDLTLRQDPLGRRGACQREIRFVQERREMVPVIENELAAGRIPTRVVHGDTKLNNVLFDRHSGTAVSIVDLDTCMPGYSLYDFGDLVRFTAARSDEDERDLDRVGTDLELYRALVDGYLENGRSFLTDLEIELMPFAARLVTLTIGMRFLTDHLAGDTYFKISRTDHNLDRARVQFRMVEEMERRENEMQVR